MDQLVTIIINNGIGVGCAIAILWFAWFRETRTIPMLINTFDKAIGVFEKAQTKAMESQYATQQMMQESFSERTDKTLDSFTRLVREERSNYERWHGENRALLNRVAEEIKENRHSMKDIAYSIGLKKTLREFEAGKRTPSNPYTEGGEGDTPKS